MAKNSNLHGAKRAKKDEFYTQWPDIEKEVTAYLNYDPDVFRDKTLLLPCDDPEWSNFTKFFALRFREFGLKKLISISLAPAATGQGHPRGKILVLDREDDRAGDCGPAWSYLQGDGDFRSDEVKALRDEADMVITNPPFSLFREFLAWLSEGDVSFSIIGNTNAITYKEVYPLIKDNRLWLGATGNSSDMVFRVPAGAKVRDEDRKRPHGLAIPAPLPRSTHAWATPAGSPISSMGAGMSHCLLGQWTTTCASTKGLRETHMRTRRTTISTLSRFRPPRVSPATTRALWVFPSRFWTSTIQTSLRSLNSDMETMEKTCASYKIRGKPRLLISAC